MHLIKASFLLAIILTLLTPIGPVQAQTPDPGGPYYVVQSGDTLWSIAVLFGVSLDDLQQANGIGDADQIALGDRLLIPGVQGYQGELSVQTVGLGETLQTLSARYAIPPETLATLNHLTSPTQLYAGASLILPAGGDSAPTGGALRLADGQSLLETAILHDVSPWELISTNALAGAWEAIPGQVYTFPGPGSRQPSALPPEIQSFEMTPLPLVQGKTAEIRIQAPPGWQLSGALAGLPLNFFPIDGGYVALQGIHNQLTPGLYSLQLKIGFPPAADGAVSADFTFSQSVAVLAGQFIIDPPLNVDPHTVDPAVTGPEDAQWAELGKPVTPDKLWDGLFQSPVPPEFKDCWTSLFGNRRTYNGGVLSSYHGGLDFCGQIGTPLYAPAAGKVVYTGSQVVRGNVTVIDHGWGVYTAYGHQSQILVKAGDVVTPGEEIGLGGATGRTTGPHLHFEVWVGGIQVDPVDWLKRAYP
jgi:murein DD-endopeptidase MepM/ murein hydrolase activator NlpD